MSTAPSSSSVYRKNLAREHARKVEVRSSQSPLESLSEGAETWNEKKRKGRKVGAPFADAVGGGGGGGGAGGWGGVLGGGGGWSLSHESS